MGRRPADLAAPVALLLAALPTLAASMFTVPLSKQRVPVTVQGRTVSHKTAYFGTIFVGLPVPQSFSVVFDTGSGHLFLPSSSCQDEPCLKHRRYERTASGSAVDINDDGSPVALSATGEEEERDRVSVAYGTGEILGEFVREVVCLGAPAGPAAPASEHCASSRVVLAREMTPEPFGAFEFDGVLGLGLDSLALDPEFHLFGQLTRGKSLEPVFGVFLAANGSGAQSEVAFGGHDAGRMRGPLQWAPVAAPELGYWMVQIRGVRVGNSSVPLCDDGGCTAVLDTGTSMLGVPRQGLQSLTALTARELRPEASAEDCRSVPGPAIAFDLGGFWLRLDAPDYTRPAATQLQSRAAGSQARAFCRGSLLPVEMPNLGPKVFIFGEPVLQKYYTAYDSRAQRVGFAPAAQQPAAGLPTQATAASAAVLV